MAIFLQGATTVDLMRKHGWKSPETAMRYIKDTKIHARIMADKVAGTSVSAPPGVPSGPPPGTSSGPPPRQPRLMPVPTPQSSCQLCLGGTSYFNLCDKEEFRPKRESINVEENALEIKGEKSGHRPYFNLAGAQNVTINFN